MKPSFNARRRLSRLEQASNYCTGGGSSSAPQAPVFHPLNIAQISEGATQGDIAASDYNYNELANRLPGMVSAQNADIDSAYKQLTGPLDPTLQNTFLNQGVGGALGAVGGGDPMSALALQKGSFAKGAASASVANQTTNYQTQTQQYLESLLAANPQQWYGLSGADIASLNLYNTGAANQASLGAYQSAISAANLQFQQQQAQLNAVGSAVGGLTKAYGNYNTYSYGSVPSNYGQGFYG